MLNENVSSGNARRARMGGIQSRPVGPISNTEVAKSHSDAKEKFAAGVKAAGDEAHKTATSKGMSPAEAETRRKAAERKASKLIKNHTDLKPFGEYIKEVAAWQRKEGKNKKGGLNEKGRKSYERANPGSNLKAPSKEVGNPRRASFCARMKGMKEKLTSEKTARDPDSRINMSLRAWNC